MGRLFAYRSFFFSLSAAFERVALMRGVKKGRLGLCGLRGLAREDQQIVYTS